MKIAVATVAGALTLAGLADLHRRPTLVVETIRELFRAKRDER